MSCYVIFIILKTYNLVINIENRYVINNKNERAPTKPGTIGYLKLDSFDTDTFLG